MTRFREQITFVTCEAARLGAAIVRRLVLIVSSAVVFLVAMLAMQVGEAHVSVPSVEAERTFELIVRSSITIDRPIKEVWPSFLDMNTWMTANHLENAEGEPGKEGEMRRVTPVGGGPETSYFIKTVRITPFEQYVLKVLSKQRSGYAGFADFSFTEAAGKTHLVYDIYVERSLPELNAEDLQRFGDEQYTSARKDLAEVLANLKSLVEATGKDAKPTVAH